jgi:hypothetical protein
MSWPPRCKPTISQPKISCANGTVRNGACVCARNQKPVKAGKSAWRCVTVLSDPPTGKHKADKLKVKTATKKPAKPKRTTTSSAAQQKGHKGKVAKKKPILFAAL